MVLSVFLIEFSKVMLNTVYFKFRDIFLFSCGLFHIIVRHKNIPRTSVIMSTAGKVVSSTYDEYLYF
jgi:hypothetical protein